MKKILSLLTVVLIISACEKHPFLQTSETAGKASRMKPDGNPAFNPKEEPAFTPINRTVVPGGTGAAEICAYDALTKKLFVVNNGSLGNRIDIYDFTQPAQPVAIGNISMAPYGGLVNSVAVHSGKLAAAIESTTKTNPGKVVVFSTDDYHVLANVTVGALPDMVTFSPDGAFILTANEGEPNEAYTIDPVGSLSIISVHKNYAVKTLDFSPFETKAAELKAQGFRIFGRNASFAQDIEPEYIAVAENAQKAWVTLQENNGIALIDLVTQTITDIFPLGFKDYNRPENSIDPSDQDGGIFFHPWRVKGVYMPDAIAVLPHNNVPFVFTANEGDAREYAGYNEVRRVNNNAVLLDPTSFPDVTQVKPNAKLGRLNITTSLGDSDGDGDYDELYAFGARSFSIWHGLTGQMIYDSRDFIDKEAFRQGKYPDGRSDDKGCEPEGLATGRVGNKNLLFVGLERANAVMVFDVTNPVRPQFLQWLNSGVAPEGVLFIPAAQSPTGKSLLVVSCETDGTIWVYTTAS